MKAIWTMMLPTHRRWLAGGLFLATCLALCVLVWPHADRGEAAAPGRIAPPKNSLGNPIDSRPGFPQPPAGQIPAWQASPPSPPTFVPPKVPEPPNPAVFRPSTDAPSDPPNRPRRPVPGL